MIDGEPWFVAVDVCKCLGFPASRGATMYVAKLDEDEKRKDTLKVFAGRGSPATLVSRP